MSGGHFDYGCFRISKFAEELQHEIENNDDTTNDWGQQRGREYNEGTIERLRICQKLIAKAGELAREVEWLYSGDHSEESFQKLIDGIFAHDG